MSLQVSGPSGTLQLKDGQLAALDALELRGEDGNMVEGMSMRDFLLRYTRDEHHDGEVARKIGQICDEAGR